MSDDKLEIFIQLRVSRVLIEDAMASPEAAEQISGYLGRDAFNRAAELVKAER